MEDDEAIPPPICRASREALKLQAALDEMLGGLQVDDVEDDSDVSSDDAAPPPISRSRSASLGTTTPPRALKRPALPPPTPPLKSSMRAWIEPESEPDLVPQPLRISSRTTPETSPRTPKQYTFKAFEEPLMSLPNVSTSPTRKALSILHPSSTQEQSLDPISKVAKTPPTSKKPAAHLEARSPQDDIQSERNAQQQSTRPRSNSQRRLPAPSHQVISDGGSSKEPLSNNTTVKSATEKRRSAGDILDRPDPSIPFQRQQQHRRPTLEPVRVPNEAEPDLFRSPKRKEPLRIPPSPDSPQSPAKISDPEPTQYKTYVSNSSSKINLGAEQRTQRAARDHSRNFSHPFNNPSGSTNSLTSYNLQKRSPKVSQNRPKPYRSNSKLPPSLRRWSSLETIDSVTTTPEVAYQEEVEIEVQRPSTSTEETSFYFSAADEEDNTETPRSFRSVPSTTEDDSSGSSSAKPSSVRTAPTTTNSNRQSAGSSLLRRLKAKKLQEPLLEPEHLQIERTVSVEQTSVHRSNSSGSVGTISSGRPSLVGYPSSDASASRESQRSIDPKDWKSSSYDVSNLTEAELKKCKKKGINPALFAEMKAARKGKWASPIGGNTFL